MNHIYKKYLLKYVHTVKLSPYKLKSFASKMYFLPKKQICRTTLSLIELTAHDLKAY